MTDVEDRVRNIGIVAHVNAGKTTLTERFLFTTGVQRVMGEVDDGTAAMDFLAEEQRRGISIAAAVTRVTWKDHRINIVDTPGHVDFSAEVERCLRVLDGVVVVLDAIKGVESQTEVVWRQADTRGIARVVFVNKLDRPGADFSTALVSLRERLDVTAIPVVVPIMGEDGELAGLLDIVTQRSTTWRAAPEVPTAAASTLRTDLVEACAEFDDGILADFVEARSISPDRLAEALRRGVVSGRIVPVIAGAALPNRGVDLLLDAVCAYLPSPADLPPVVSLDGGRNAPRRRPSLDEPLCALVFKSQEEGGDAFHFIRLYSGSVTLGDEVARAPGEDPFRVTGLWRVHGERHEELRRAEAGDIVALEAEAPLRTGDTLFTPGFPMRLEPVHFPRPVLTVAIEPRSPEDMEMIERAAFMLARDDPTLQCHREADSGRLLVSGMGELHLEVFGSRLARRVGDRVRVGRPTVACQETITRAASSAAECRSGDGGGTARRVSVSVTVEPAEGSGNVRVEVAAGDPAIQDILRAELRGRLATGLTAGYPATDMVVRVDSVEGDATEDPAGEALCLEALTVAFRKALAAAGPVLLEPIMSIEVECPTDVLSGVLADLRSRQAEIGDVEAVGGMAQVRGDAPLVSLLGYPTELRSLSRGLGTVSLRPEGFRRRAIGAPENAAPVLDPPPPAR